jgi:uncharacterized protein YndB with AHSA1/START domain
MARSNVATMAEARTMNTKTASASASAPGNRATVEAPADEPKVIITRWFEAPRALVFEAMTKPEHVRRWWGLRGSNMIKCEIDFRVGGNWHYILGDKDGQMGFKGTYREIEAPSRVVNTMIYDVEFIRDHPALETIRLEEIGGRTKFTNVIVYEAMQFRDGHVASGMEWGMNETFGRLDELLASLQS